MPIREMTAEQAVDAITESIRELTAAAGNLERALKGNPHQERAVRVMQYEVGELTSAKAALSAAHALGATDGKDVPPIKAGPQLPDASPLLTGQPTPQEKTA